MAGDFIREEELKLKGMQKYFNSYTLRGRFNWVVATYGTIFGFFLVYKVSKFLKKRGVGEDVSTPAINKSSVPDTNTAGDVTSVKDKASAKESDIGINNGGAGDNNATSRDNASAKVRDTDSADDDGKCKCPCPKTVENKKSERKNTVNYY